MNHDQEMRRLAELIGAIQYGMLTTINEQGCLESRPMETANASDFDGTLWFFTSDNSPKSGQVARDQHVNVAYCDTKGHRFASLQGTATLVHDPEMFERFWTSTQRAWFPEGLNDPHLALLKVEVHSAQYWDSASKPIQFLKWVQAVVTKSPNAAEDIHKLEVKKSA